MQGTGENVEYSGECSGSSNQEPEKRKATGEIVRAGGMCSLEMMHGLCNQIYSFIQTISLAPLQVHYYRPTQRRFRHYTDTVPEFHAEAPQATVSEGLAQGPCMAAIARVKLQCA